MAILSIFAAGLLLLHKSCAAPAVVADTVSSVVESAHVLGAADTIVSTSQRTLSPIEDTTVNHQTIPSKYQSTVLGRRLLALSGSGFLSTDFPHHTSGRIPSAVHDTPISLPEYIASCEEPTGNPTVLAITISTAAQNAYAGSNVSLAVSWWDEYVRITHKEPWSYANLPRLSLTGYLEEIPQEDIERHDLAKCFTSVHPDSRLWLPGNKASPHLAVWMRLVVQEAYWVGGFGNLNYIGWFDPEEWHGVTTAEWQSVRLPGEKQ